MLRQRQEAEREEKERKKKKKERKREGEESEPRDQTDRPGHQQKDKNTARKHASTCATPTQHARNNTSARKATSAAQYTPNMHPPPPPSVATTRNLKLIKMKPTLFESSDNGRFSHCQFKVEHLTVTCAREVHMKNRQVHQKQNQRQGTKIRQSTNS